MKKLVVLALIATMGLTGCGATSTASDNTIQETEESSTQESETGTIYGVIDGEVVGDWEDSYLGYTEESTEVEEEVKMSDELTELLPYFLMDPNLSLSEETCELMLNQLNTYQPTMSLNVMTAMVCYLNDGYFDYLAGCTLVDFTEATQLYEVSGSRDGGDITTFYVTVLADRGEIGYVSPDQSYESAEYVPMYISYDAEIGQLSEELSSYLADESLGIETWWYTAKNLVSAGCYTVDSIDYELNHPLTLIVESEGMTYKINVESNGLAANATDSDGNYYAILFD